MHHTALTPASAAASFSIAGFKRVYSTQAVE